MSNRRQDLLLCNPLRITSLRRCEPASGARATVSIPQCFSNAADPAVQPVQSQGADGNLSCLDRGWSGRSRLSSGWSETAVPTSPIFLFAQSVPGGMEPARFAVTSESGRPIDKSGRAKPAAPLTSPADFRQMHGSEFCSAATMHCSVRKASILLTHLFL